MSRAIFALDQISVASPCPAAWDSMSGDDRVRFCGECARNVYNLSGMSRGDAEALLREREGRVCVRFYRRSDGTVLTQDCPVGLRALRRRLVWALSLVAALLLGLIGLGAAVRGGGLNADGSGTSLRDLEPFRTIGWLDPNPPGGLVMGECPPPAPPVAPPGGGAPGNPDLPGELPNQD